VNNPRSEDATVLISSVGRRSQLVEGFRRALNELGVSGRVLGVDCNPQTAPAAYLVDQCFAVQSCRAAGFIDDVLRIAIEENVRLIVPTIDPELPVYAANRQRFLDHGIEVAISDAETVAIASDKVATHLWLVENGFPTPRQDGVEEVLRHLHDWTFPLIAKPRGGSASIGISIVQSPVDLEMLTMQREQMIVQEIALGDEYTVNVFVRNGRSVCAVPHLRLETRAGEVSKGMTVRDERLMTLASKIAEALPGARGALNVQCFAQPGGALKVIEINARFGGGFPLADRAGARFPLWLLESVLKKPGTESGEWQAGLVMLRYDSAVFVPGVQVSHG
jgi:carbamoyl-phosphate synthase large subunit